MNTNDPKRPPYQNPNSKYSSSSSDPLRVPPGDPESSERNSRKLDSMYGFGNPSTVQIVTYVLLVIGLVAIFFNNLLGSAIVGGVVGYYYSEEIIYYLKNAARIFNHSDPLRAIIISSLIIAVFISAPGFFLGLVVAAIRHLLFNNSGI